MAEPDFDGDVDGAAPDEVAFVVAGGHSAVLPELAEGSFDGVAVAVGGGSGGGWPGRRCGRVVAGGGSGLMAAGWWF